MGKDFEITFTVDGKTIAGDRILKKEGLWNFLCCGVT